MKIYSDAKAALNKAEKESKGLKPLDSLIAKNQGSKKSIEQILAKKLKRAERKDRLLPKDRKCPRCQLVKMERQRWVLSKGICRACIWAGAPEKVKESFFEVEEIGIRYRIDRFDQMFLLANPTLISKMLGEPWTSSQIFNIQHRRNKTISREEKEFLGAHWPDFIFTEDRAQLRIKNNKLKELREYLGISQRDFARNCNWAKSKQNKIEKGLQYASKEDIQKIREVLDKLCSN